MLETSLNRPGFKCGPHLNPSLPDWPRVIIQSDSVLIALLSSSWPCLVFLCFSPSISLPLDPSIYPREKTQCAPLTPSPPSPNSTTPFQSIHLSAPRGTAWRLVHLSSYPFLLVAPSHPRRPSPTLHTSSPILLTSILSFPLLFFFLVFSPFLSYRVFTPPLY